MRTTALFISCTVAVLFSAFVICWGGSSAGGTDSSGYLNSARLILAGQTGVEARQVSGVPLELLTTWERTPVGFWPAKQNGWIAPIYPVGFPLHIAAFASFVGLERAVILVNLGAFLLAALLFWVIGRRLSLEPLSIAIATVLFAIYPITVLHFSRVMSDGLATTWVMAAVAAALSARRHRGFAVLSGVALGIAVLVRPTNVLLIPAIVAAERGRWRDLAATAAGGAPAAILLGWYNWTLYGRIITTGYGDVSSTFSSENILPCLLHFGTWLNRLSGPFLLVAVVFSVITAFRGDWRHRVLSLWILPIFVFYLTYWHSQQGWWRLRFILPIQPALIFAALLLVQHITGTVRDRWPSNTRLRIAATVGLTFMLALGAGCSVYEDLRGKLWTRARSEAVYPRAVAWAESQVEDDAVILCKQTSGAITYSSHLAIVRYDHLFEDSEKQLYEGAARGDVHLYALLFKSDLAPFERRYGNEWLEVGQLGQARLLRPPQQEGRFLSVTQ